MLLSLVFASAHADTIPSWKWPAGPVKFHVETQITTPRGTRYYAAENVDARAGEVKVRADIACTAKPEGKVQVIGCTFAYVDVKGIGWTPQEAAKLDTVLAEWSADLKTASVELVQGPDGHIRSFDMKGGKDRSNAREGAMIEAQRMLLQRLFCFFDLPITTDDKDWVRGWKQKGDSQLMQLQTTYGTAGATDMTHSHDGERYGLTVIATSGHATLSSGAALDAESGSRLVDVRFAGETLFDPGPGTFAWRDFQIDGRLTVGSQEAGSGAEYFQSGAMERVDEFPLPGDIPLTVAAIRAPKLTDPPAAPPAGAAIVPFADLGMAQLFVAGMPDAAKELGLPRTSIGARVVVGADGLPTSVKAFRGYVALAAATETALTAARFPAKGAPYVVDVDLEWRPAE